MKFSCNNEFKKKDEWRAKSFLLPFKRLNSSLREPANDEMDSNKGKNNMVQSAKGSISHANGIICKTTLSIENNSSEES
jgi:hypothetical protein